MSSCELPLLVMDEDSLSCCEERAEILEPLANPAPRVTVSNGCRVNCLAKDGQPVEALALTVKHDRLAARCMLRTLYCSAGREHGLDAQLADHASEHPSRHSTSL